MGNPRFHALMPVRDEADILPQSLRHMLTWADAIYIFDTGSVDDTWEIVQEFAAKDQRVIPLKKDNVSFSDSLVRGWLFHQARKNMREGDWFLRVDADEFHHVPPPEFVRTRLSKFETRVGHQYYDFRLTSSDVKDWESGAETFADRKRPIEERRQWFTVTDYSEQRLFRYRETMAWPTGRSLPYNAGYLARSRLPIRHYPHRDPAQLQRRVRLRSIMIANFNKDWVNPEQHHWSKADWSEFIAPDDLPELCHWQPGTELPDFHYTSHLRSQAIRTVQRLIHACFLPVLDRTRAHWKETDYPPKLNAKLVELLKRELDNGK